MKWITPITLTALTLWLLPAAQAAPKLSAELGQRLEAEVATRAASLRGRYQRQPPSSANDALAKAPKRSSASRHLPARWPRRRRQALLVGQDGRETWTWVQAQVEASVPTVVAAGTHAVRLGDADVELWLPHHRQNFCGAALCRPSPSAQHSGR